MKIEEARITYNYQIKAFGAKQRELYEKKQALEEKIKTTEDGAVIYQKEAETLNLQYNAVSEKRQEYQNYMEKLMEQWAGVADMVSSEQQADAMEEQAKEMSKILLIARRIMHGDKVPIKDEKKLMEFDPKLYNMAKNIGAMAEIRKRKEHKSLWEDEEKKENPDAIEEANNTEAFSDGLEIVDVEATMAAATPAEAAMPETNIDIEC